MHDIEVRQNSINVWSLLMAHKNIRTKYLFEVAQNTWVNFE